jgi:uncharacterized protein YjbI with pentapeptide repeats
MTTKGFDMDADKLKAILESHKLWLDSNGEQGIRADLIGADLRGAELREADLSYADLSYADLSYADLSYADLSSAELRHADLRHADLREANLSHANLRSAELREADLSSADLSSADLRSADLEWANLIGAHIDYSAWPLWCGSNNVKVDARIAAQLAAHFCALDCHDTGYIAARAAILDFAKTSHRAEELGLLEDGDGN